MASFRGSYYRLNAYQEPAIPKGLTEVRTHGVNGAPPEQLVYRWSAAAVQARTRAWA